MQDKHKFKQLGTIYESMVTHDEDEEGDQAMSDRYRTQDEVRSRGEILDQLKQAQQVNSKYKFRKFSDGWWSLIYYASLENWGKWRGPFDTKADAEIDCAKASRGEYSL